MTHVWSLVCLTRNTNNVGLKKTAQDWPTTNTTTVLPAGRSSMKRFYILWTCNVSQLLIRLARANQAWPLKLAVTSKHVTGEWCSLTIRNFVGILRNKINMLTFLNILDGLKTNGSKTSQLKQTVQTNNMSVHSCKIKRTGYLYSVDIPPNVAYFTLPLLSTIFYPF